ncbi:hypothetical protein HZF24_02350 [Sedimentibacter hydroxybenzoicus DSM 7310]|uniref:Uncharacterized protein n=1 Tax=Sedimentibacter hydroxybenzoicus DSM 7310 TaxID=1123245 RepID=A0A974BGZ8_SEDHY|nr:hypothetical protein [Sedimentibacter hydroxybenzoicus]NYB72978.1 hypothetical protein [Sedimentibacter hydroxybenzoicus DSM 7310]
MLNIRKKAHYLIDKLPEDQVAYLVKIIEGIKGLSIPSGEPDELDMFLIKESQTNNEDTMTIEDLIEELGIDANELQD